LEKYVKFKSFPDVFMRARQLFYVIGRAGGEKFHFRGYIISRTILKTGTLRDFFAPETFGMPLCSRFGRGRAVMGRLSFFILDIQHKEQSGWKINRS
jgi:hypothetical protein